MRKTWNRLKLWGGGRSLKAFARVRARTAVSCAGEVELR